MAVGLIIIVFEVDFLKILFRCGKFIAADRTAIHHHGSFINDSASASVHAVVVFDLRSRIDV